HRCPVFDRTVSALLEDLADRGLLETTLVLAVAEFGRSPKIGSPTTNNVGPRGRDHRPSCYTALLAGGGVRRRPASRDTHPAPTPKGTGCIRMTCWRRSSTQWGSTRKRNTATSSTGRAA